MSQGFLNRADAGYHRRIMSSPSNQEITQLLKRWSGGEAEALPELMDQVYWELKKLAESCMRREAPGHTLETGALIHEVFLKLIDQDAIDWQGRVHFFGVAVRIMRRILVDHARYRSAQKRGGSSVDASLDEAFAMTLQRPSEFLALDEALSALEETDEEQARIVELRFFGGFTYPEIAEMEGLSVPTVERRWRVARAWLFKTLSPPS